MIKMKINDLPKISFGLSLVTPVIFLFTILGFRNPPNFLIVIMLLSVLGAIVLSIVSLVNISRKKIKNGFGISLTALILGIFLLFIWILGYMFAIASMPIL